jgi:UDP-2-acetamido-2-deoxy-ribo-hexuluronate aminotransferase
MRLEDPRVAYYGMSRRAAADRALIKRALAEAADGERPILGERVAELERSLCERLGVGHAVAVSSGTTAILLALRALELGRADEVIVPTFGFHSTLTAAIRCGATPVLVDVDPAGLIDPVAVAAAASARTRAIVAVHMFAATAEMDVLARLAAARGACLVENAAVAIGMRHAGRQAGTFGEVAVFSFHPYKPLGGVTDGGALVTRDARLADSARRLRNHGQDGVNRFLHHSLGYNARMDEVAAAVLLGRLRSLDGALRRRAAIARRYDEAFGDLRPELGLPAGEESRAGCYAYVVRSRERDALERHLARGGVETVVYYPRPLHLQLAFAGLGHAVGDFPEAERLCAEALALPLYPQLPERELEHAIEAVRSFHGR